MGDTLGPTRPAKNHPAIDGVCPAEPHRKANRDACEGETFLPRLFAAGAALRESAAKPLAPLERVAPLRVRSRARSSQRKRSHLLEPMPARWREVGCPPHPWSPRNPWSRFPETSPFGSSRSFMKMNCGDLPCSSLSDLFLPEHFFAFPGRVDPEGTTPNKRRSETPQKNQISSRRETARAAAFAKLKGAMSLVSLIRQSRTNKSLCRDSRSERTDNRHPWPQSLLPPPLKYSQVATVLMGGNRIQ